MIKLQQCCNGYIFAQKFNIMRDNLMIWALLIVLGLLMTGCSKDDPEIPNEEEVITTLIYTLVPEGGGNTVTMTYRDLAGDGKNPSVTGGTLAVNKTYRGSQQLLNELESPAEDITEEIEEEDDEHQFFFISTVPGLTVKYNDRDKDGLPVGLKTELTTSSAGSGTLTIILRHEPNKKATGVSAGNIANAGGETDIEVVFNVNVQ